MYDYGVIVEDLLEWYDANARVLPWRSEPKPYYVWVSEIMLQQTRVEAVKGYFARFIKELPDVAALAEVKEDELLKLWEGLGYYNRARNLQAAAKTIMEEYNGRLPEEYKELQKLKGIGSYTAGAIASIAYGKPVPAVDGNVLRVMKRLAGSYDDILKASVKTDLEKALTKIMPKRAGAFNQAIMDLGAMVCLPNGKPLCEECPLQKYCVAYKKNIVMEIPVKTPKKKRKIEEKTILVLEYEGKFALHKREDRGLLAGLWEFPNISGKIKKESLMEIVEEENFIVKELGESKHIFSHIEWRMIGYYIHLSKKTNKDYIWVTREELVKQYAIPSAFSAYVQEIMK
ncbi:MAG: A/G-specific adenine glycosylase [Lachnospiraceae bacterium]|nr:A/G-specific adenine glycosylase [Lachnospiraceae bacterium]